MAESSASGLSQSRCKTPSGSGCLGGAEGVAVGATQACLPMDQVEFRPKAGEQKRGRGNVGRKQEAGRILGWPAKCILGAIVSIEFEMNFEALHATDAREKSELKLATERKRAARVWNARGEERCNLMVDGDLSDALRHATGLSE